MNKTRIIPLLTLLALTLAACEGCQQRLPTVAVLPQPVVEGPRPGGCGG